MKSYTLEEIAELTGSRLIGDPSKRISNVADLESAQESDASFLANPRYEGAMRKSQAGVIFAQPSYASEKGRAFLLHDEPSRAFQILVELIVPHAETFTEFKGIHPSAIVHPTAKLGEGVEVGPHAVIDAKVEIGRGTHVGAGVYIGPFTVIGDLCRFMPHVTIRERTIIGHRVTLQPGCVIGSCGFGYTQDKEGHHIKLNQVGKVVIEDDVEIGANTTIDRSRFKETRIGHGTKIDNLVQIGHGVIIGPHNLIIAQAGIAGSTKTGKHVILAGQTALAGHIDLADGVVIAAKSGVSKSLHKPGKYNGIPAVPLEEYNRNAVFLRRIEDFVKRLKAVEENVRICKEIISPS